MQSAMHRACNPADSVSILIRPEGRMQSGPHSAEARPASFNPHPARRPDAISPSWLCSQCRHMFQSSSGQKAGCNRWSACGTAGGPPRFQSSSGQKAGCNSRVAFAGVGGCGFQSSSGQKAGCNVGATLGMTAAVTSFNPHPARRPDAIILGEVGACHNARFNPHPARRPDAIGQRSRGQDTPDVSILIRPEGRMQ